ncbi:hypothetical protein AB0E78_41700 [Streptomyces sp. NPDC032198]|uniref:hypothetical protein n=1 Tax=Streptomyces sp. NPDC032198 TaxID=3155127 RepID=UPI0033D51756
MPDWMPLWGTTVLIALGTSLLTSIVAGRYLSPLLEVRNRRFQAKMLAREKFQENMLDTLSAGMHLRAVPVAPAASDTVRTALLAEAARWSAQVDETTKYLTDHAVQLLVAYRGSRLPELAVRYSGTARAAWISDRSKDRKLQSGAQPSAGPFLDGTRTATDRTGDAGACEHVKTGRTNWF